MEFFLSITILFLENSYIQTDKQRDGQTEIIELELCLLIYSHKSKLMISFNWGKIKALDKTYNSNVSNMYVHRMNIALLIGTFYALASLSAGCFFNKN